MTPESKGERDNMRVGGVPFGLGIDKPTVKEGDGLGLVVVGSVS